ncbi:hypothetical protein jhhlp_000174 [Lomentospora prolificans]|uniref:Uncharacterized protein n=1 Tax=Lomentospora prolificans TaxID=41688 RepID=A0A2N3NLT6_9PEZI|nr:hypothetical protein jhhlp_000174 [Lomentospora prolificans]
MAGIQDTDKAKTPASPPKSPTTPTSPRKPIGEPTPGGILPAEHWARAQGDDDAESALGASLASSTTSITSTILHYRTINGRGFHGEIGNVSYCQTWPCGGSLVFLLTCIISHSANILACKDKLYMAPLDTDKIQVLAKSTKDNGLSDMFDRKLALGLGTGTVSRKVESAKSRTCDTGIWAIDFADELPNAQVIGTDISVPQPTWVPQNLKFEIEDFIQEWTFAPESFDYIHSRWLLGSVIDWDNFFAEAYKCCEPGGWVASSEPSGFVESDEAPIRDDSTLGKWGKFFIEGGKTIGRTL